MEYEEGGAGIYSPEYYDNEQKRLIIKKLTKSDFIEIKDAHSHKFVLNKKYITYIEEVNPKNYDKSMEIHLHKKCNFFVNSVIHYSHPIHTHFYLHETLKEILSKLG